MSNKTRDAQLRALSNALATAPGLGAFAVAVAMHGLDAAVELCGTREPDDRLKLVWQGLGYTLAELPTKTEIDCIILGVEALRVNWMRARNSKPALELFVLAEDMGCAARDIHKGIQLLKSYGAEVCPPAFPSKAKMGAI